ncbi:hypothetical protein MAJ_08858, partial [Metarhizium majus ARSEF 297]
MASRPFATRDFDAGKFSSGFFFIIVPVVILLIAGVASSAVRYARRSRRRRATTADDDFTTDRPDQRPPSTIHPSLITQLQNLSPEPYALSSYPSQQTLDETHEAVTPLQSVQLREPYERRHYAAERSPSGLSL